MRALPVLLVSAWAAACGAEDPLEPSHVPAAELFVDARAPLARAMSEAARLPLSGPVERLGATAAGHPLVVVEGAVHEVLTSGLVARALFAAPGDPTALGAVSALAPRAAGGAWIAAEGGLFALDGHYLGHRDTGAAGAPIAVTEVAQGPLAGLWVVTTAGLFHRTPAGRVEQVEVEAQQWAVDADGRAALALDAAGALQLVEAEDVAWVRRAPSLAEAGAVRAIAAGPGVLWAATEGGLLRWRAADAPRWTLFPVGGLRALAVDPSTGAAWTHTGRALVHATPDGVLESSALATSATAAVAVDAVGDAWLAEGASLRRITRAAPSEAVTFAEHVAPWITVHCAACHQNATADFDRYEVFAERAEAALARVRSGDMPRCAGGRPCAEARLDEPDYAVVERWIRQGKPR